MSFSSHIRSVLWQLRGRPAPPPDCVKHAIVLSYGPQSGRFTLVETGTYQGRMVAACVRAFSRIYTIELSPSLHAAACQQFRSSPHVSVLNGDSASVLPAVLNAIREPAVFWLDAHYSGSGTARASINTPIREEIRAILDHPTRTHAILIDDARLFGTDPAYPTVQEIEALVAGLRPDLSVCLSDDVLRILPRYLQL